MIYKRLLQFLTFLNFEGVFLRLGGFIFPPRSCPRAPLGRGACPWGSGRPQPPPTQWRARGSARARPWARWLGPSEATFSRFARPEPRPARAFLAEPRARPPWYLHAALWCGCSAVCRERRHPLCGSAGLSAYAARLGFVRLSCSFGAVVLSAMWFACFERRWRAFCCLVVARTYPCAPARRSLPLGFHFCSLSAVRSWCDLVGLLCRRSVVNVSSLVLVRIVCYQCSCFGGVYAAGLACVFGGVCAAVFVVWRRPWRRLDAALGGVLLYR